MLASEPRDGGSAIADDRPLSRTRRAVACWPFHNNDNQETPMQTSRKAGVIRTPLAAFLAVTLTTSALAQTPAPNAAPTPPKRFPQVTLDTLPKEARPLAEEITKISSVGLSGPYNIMLRSPVMADRMKRLLDYLRFNNSLPAKLSEFAILIQGRLFTSNVEWYAHSPLALKAGLSESVLADLKANLYPRGMKEDEQVVYDVCMQLSNRQHISDDLFNHAKKVLGEQQIVDLVAISGTYVALAMMLNLGEEDSPLDKPAPFPETRPAH
jgi:4-carboxymuconolactone decarboxylase